MASRLGMLRFGCNEYLACSIQVHGENAETHDQVRPCQRPNKCRDRAPPIMAILAKTSFRADRKAARVREPL